MSEFQAEFQSQMRGVSKHLAARIVLRIVCLGCLVGVSSARAQQMATSEATAQVVPQLVRYAGLAPERAGDTVQIEFRIYAGSGGESDSEPLWSEVQTVVVGKDGHYSVLLGAASQSGLPQGVFAAGQGQWLGVSIEGAAELPRIKLASVAYAMKAGDAETLGGRPLAEFVTQEQLRAMAAAQTAAQELAARQVLPETTPALTGSGTANAIAFWTTASNLSNSAMYQSGSGTAAKIGIGLAAPASALDVNGGTTLRGVVSLLAPSSATATAGVNSPYFEFNASSYNSSTSAPVAQKFAWGVLASGNDTPTPSSNFNLLYGQGTTGVGPTGFSISPKGILTFAPGQTFPGASGGSGTITGVTAGTGLTGGGTTGAVTLSVDPTQVPLLSSANTFTQNQTIGGNLSATNASFATMYATSTVQGGSVTSLGGLYGQGTVHMTPLTTATASNGGGASFLEASASTWNSSTNAAVPQNFFWGALPVGNNTASPSGALNFLYSNGGGGYNTTGLSIDPTGIITFANGQKFPVPSSGAGSGTITGVTAGTGLTGGGTTGTVTVNVDTAKVPLLTSANTFTQGQTVKGRVTASSFSANNPSGLGVFGGSSGTLSTTGSQYGPYRQTGMWADAGPDTADGSFGLYATADNSFAGYFQNNNARGDNFPALQAENIGTGLSLVAFTSGYGTAFYAQSEDTSQVKVNQIASYNASIWGDSSEMTGIIGSSDAYSGGSFFNDGEYHATVNATNYYSGGAGTGLAIPAGGVKGFATVIRAEGNGGVCGMNTEGDVSCTGQMKSLSTVSGSRQVETYSVQSSENWFEDFGSATLESGRATVTIDAAFAETVNTGVEYHVYLTPNGDSKGLYVTNKGAGSFEVHESGGGTSSIAFDYRIVAKRKGHETERLVDVTERFQAEKAAAAPPPPQPGQNGYRARPSVPRPGVRGASMVSKPLAH